MTAFFHTGIEILLWCCIWSCRHCGWACPGRTGSTRPCHWQWSSPHTAGTARRTSLIERDRNDSGEADSLYLKGFLEGNMVCSQTLQSSQHSKRLVWKFEGWNLPGWVVTAMITNMAWRMRRFCFWASEIVDRSEGWRFESYQVMEVKDSKTSKGALLDPRLSLTDRERVTVALLKVVSRCFHGSIQWHSHDIVCEFITFNRLKKVWLKPLHAS